MQTLEYEIGGKRESLQVPESLAEMNSDQFREAAKMIIKNSADDHSLSVMTGMPGNALKVLSDFQRIEIASMFDFLYSLDSEDLNFKDWKIPSLKIGKDVFFAPESNFGNTTWEEFIYVDQCMQNKLYMAVISALFRPERDGYNGETDRRIPFTISGTKYRFRKFEKLQDSDKLAVIINYRAMRHASLELSYPDIFPNFNSESDDTENKNDQKGKFSWIQVHRSLLGDKIEEEEKFLKLNVHTVLNRLNERIVENRKIKHYA